MDQISYTPEIISELHADLLEDWVVNALAALVAYDYFITIQQEVAMVWRRKWTAAIWLFVLNRYLLVLVMILANVHATASTCFGVEVTLSALELAQYIIFAIFSALRAYSLLNRTVFAAGILILVLLLNLVPVATGIVRFPEVKNVMLIIPSSARIVAILHNNLLICSRLPLGTRIPLIAADAIVIVVTWIKTVRHAKHASFLQMSISLSEILLRDGSLYFLITPILISRFLLNLRQAVSPDNTPADMDASDFSAAEFRRSSISSFVGNMGAFLDHGPGSEDEDIDTPQEHVASRPEDAEGSAPVVL
ncbi:hypothetical protein NM688_g2149 [Phlebia brevispora]|uniref:Uncharacterized protein n=1 Tax=Phlebia brevispora TaxID=194682 RepID=A0ACC1T9A6_9APHY|nr:hypothetical protein NM688_g2149 [Phlebia brevispora]